jgi:hypothetical protein
LEGWGKFKHVRFLLRLKLNGKFIKNNKTLRVLLIIQQNHSVIKREKKGVFNIRIDE